MSVENAAPGGDSQPIVSVPASDNSPLSPRDAANALSQWRWKRNASEERAAETPAEAPPEAAAPPESAPAEDAAPAQEATGEQPTETTDEPAELPPIEAPRSWSKEWKEEFKSYPREAQEKILAREQDRETNLRRGQNELAEQRKAIEAERQQVEQARVQYENALPHLLQTLHQQQMGEFADIKTMADVEKLAREDWPRYALWDAQQKKIAAVAQEYQRAEQRQSQEKQTQISRFAAEQDARIVQRHPELAAPDKAQKAGQQVIDALTELGYSRDELADLWNNPIFRDARNQEVLLGFARHREAQKAVPAKVSKPVPPVQRPGVTPAKGEENDVRIKNLEKQLQQSGNWKDAAALVMAKRASRS